MEFETDCRLINLVIFCISEVMIKRFEINLLEIKTVKNYISASKKCCVVS